MARTMRQRLLRLSKRDYRPDAWRRRPNIVAIIEQLRNVFNQFDPQYHTTTTFTMSVVDAIDEALQAGHLLDADLPQVIQRIFFETVVVRHLRKATRPIAERAVNQQVMQAMQAVQAIAAPPAALGNGNGNANPQAGGAGGQ